MLNGNWRSVCQVPTHRVPVRETLEPRRMLAIAWDGGGNGIDWGDRFNWDTDALPTAADDVVINVSGSLTVVVQAASNAFAKSISNANSLSVQGSLVSGPVDGTGDVVVPVGGSLSATHIRQTSLNVAGDVVIPANGQNSATSVLNSLSIPGGKFDLRDNNLLIDYTGASVLDAVVASISSARNGGNWNGPGLTSSAAQTQAQHNTSLGTMEALTFKQFWGPSVQFDGFSLDDSAVLVKYTYYGDADFNGLTSQQGAVNAYDYAQIDASFNIQNGGGGNIGGWCNGDFD